MGPKARRSRSSSLLVSSQAVYQRLFEWVVARINNVMETRDRDPRRDGKDTVIGVLDIYGFEVLPVNRWVTEHIPSRSSLLGSLLPRKLSRGRSRLFRVCAHWSLPHASEPASAMLSTR